MYERALYAYCVVTSSHLKFPGKSFAIKYRKNKDMQDERRDDSQFQINVNGKTYKVTYFSKEDDNYYKIETDCEYLFTLFNTETGEWQVEKDVTMLDDRLIEQMGNAIEEHDALN